MATKNVLTAIDDVADNLVEAPTTQLPLTEVKNLLDMWFENLKYPSDLSQTTQSDQNQNFSPEEKKLLERLKETKPLSPEDKRLIERLLKVKENLSTAEKKLIERLLKVKEPLSVEDQKQLERLKQTISQKDQKLIERLLKVKEPLSVEDQKQLEQLTKNLASDLQKLIERLLKVKEPLSVEDQKQLEWLLKGEESTSQAQEFEHLKGLQNYFNLLNKALAKIKQSKCYPPYLREAYIEQLRSKNNPYDFANTLEIAVDGTLHFENEIGAQTTFFLYYFHHQQLQKAASKKWFSTDKQIGRVWA